MLLNISSKANTWLYTMTAVTLRNKIDTLQRPAQGESYYATE